MITPVALLGYLLALGVGGVLGILGAGGATLTVPIFVYLFMVPPRLATVLSLGVVGGVGLLGLVRAHAKRELEWSWAVKVALPSLLTVWLTRRLLIPLFGVGGEGLLMVIFAALLAWVARVMLRPPSARGSKPVSQAGFIARSAGVGVVTGLLGAGGGFLIVPMLTEWAGLSFRVAASTSLIVIVANSAMGLLSGWSAELLPWLRVWFAFGAIAAVGLVAGARLASRIPAERLRRGFAYFLLAVAGITLAVESARYL